jgi:hypothetical protein
MDSASLEKLQDGALVRFRCMVQDNGYAPEVYMPALPLQNMGGSKFLCAKFHEPSAEGVVVGNAGGANVFADKTVFYAVSLPAESAWARHARRTEAQKHQTMDGNGLAESLESVLNIGEKLTAVASSSKKPLPWEDTVGAMVKIYEACGEYRMNEQLEVVGVLEKSAAQEGEEEMCIVHGV